MGSKDDRQSPSIKGESSPVSTVTWVCLVVAACYLAPKLEGALIKNPQMIWPLWPGSAVLVSILLLVPGRVWPILIPAGFATFAVYDLSVGVPLRSIAWFVPANTVQVLTSVLCLRYFFDGVPRLNSLKALAKYSIFAVILAPFGAAFLSASGIGAGNYWDGWRICFLSEALAFATLTPAILSWVSEGPSWVREPRARHLEAAALIVGLVLLSYFTFNTSEGDYSPAFLYSLVPFLLWAALRFEWIGISTSVILVCIFTIRGAVHNLGPFSEQHALKDMLSLQLFLTFAAMPFMALAALAEDRKVASKELVLSSKRVRESEERIRLAVQAGKMYAYEWDSATDKVLRTAECIDILGKDEPTQATRRELMARVHPDDRERVTASFLKLTPQSPNCQISYRVLALDGRTIWVEKSARALFDQDGKMLRMIGVIADVTARKQAEDTVRESEHRYRRIVETTSEGVWLLDSKFHTVFVNRQLAEMLGYDPAEMVGRDVFDFYFPEDVDRKRQRLERRQGLRENFDEHFRRRDGSGLWVRLAAIPVFKDSGEFDGALAMVSDITERRRAEEALRESEERFRFVANTAPVMIWMCGTDKLCTYVNQPWLEFTGRPLEAELGFGWVERVHPEDFSRCMDTYTQAFDRRESFQMEYRARRHDGEYRWISDTGVPRFNPDHSFAGYIGSATDVTERKLAEESLADVGRKLIEAHEEERTWIARELHDDVNQRMALLAIELDRWNQQPPPPAVEFHDHIHHAIQRLSDIAKDIQALSHRLHSSKLEYLGLVAAAKSFCKELYEQQKVEIDFSHTSIPRRMPKEISLCLFRVLQETLQNAVKHSGVRRFKVELNGTEGEIQLTVSDLGVGFDPQEAIHRRGLGLISMRERMQLVSGEFSIKSQPGSGTTIHARVPFNSISDSARAVG